VVAVSAALAFIIPPAAGTFTGDDETNFIAAALISWPLIIGVAVWGIVMTRFASHMTAPVLLGFTAVVAVGSVWLSTTLGGQSLEIEPSGGGGLSAVIPYTAAVLEAYAEAYGGWLFLTALLAGGYLVWLWDAVAERRISHLM